MESASAPVPRNLGRPRGGEREKEERGSFKLKVSSITSILARPGLSPFLCLRYLPLGPRPTRKSRNRHGCYIGVLADEVHSTRFQALRERYDEVTKVCTFSLTLTTSITDIQSGSPFEGTR